LTIPSTVHDQNATSLSKWDIRFIELALFISKWSEDKSRKIGAVIVGEANQILATGYNGMPRRVHNVDERHFREGGEKYHWFEHAERNAIFNAARSGVKTDCGRMYINSFPCADCSRAIIQAGLAKIIVPKPPEGDPVFHRSFEVAETMLREARIDVQLYMNDLVVSGA
jgi:dCMP deaminase